MWMKYKINNFVVLLFLQNLNMKLMKKILTVSEDVSSLNEELQIRFIFVGASVICESHAPVSIKQKEQSWVSNTSQNIVSFADRPCQEEGIA